MLHKVSVAESSPALTPEHIEIIERVVPILRLLRDEVKVIQGFAPNDHPDFPGSPIFVGPFYKSRFDPRESGSWLLKVGLTNDKEINARIHTLPGRDGVSYGITVADEDGPTGFRQANPDEVSKILKLMDFVCSSTKEGN